MGKTSNQKPKRPLKRPRKKISDPPAIHLSETEAALFWMSGLDEVFFRDRILRDVFRGMKAQGIISDFKYTHGPNEHGIDYFFLKPDELVGEQWIGVQAKSQEMRVGGGSGAEQPMAVLLQCETALRHEFQIGTKRGKLHAVQVWTSRKVTGYAEGDLYAPGNDARVGLKRAEDVLNLVKKYAPSFLTNLPACVVGEYVRRGKQVDSENFVLLNSKINIKDHFLEPTFSDEDRRMLSSVATDDLKIKSSKRSIKLKDVLAKKGHCVISGSPLCGKSFALKRARLLASMEERLACLTTAEFVNSVSFISVFDLLAQLFPPLTAQELESVTVNSTIVLCIDDFDKVDESRRAVILVAEPDKVRLVCTVSRTFQIEDTTIVQSCIDGVDLSSVRKVIRSIEMQGSFDRPLLDRALALVQRTFTTTGLPRTPFNVAMVLEQLDAAPQRHLNTPTLGRLINRYIEKQLGSHDDSGAKVDFETKRDFLVQVAGNERGVYDSQHLTKVIGRFLAKKGHGHRAEDLLKDLVVSGVFHQFSDGTKVGWTHDVVRLSFWASNLVSQGNLSPVIKRLREGGNLPLAAVIGSRLGNANKLIDALLEHFPKTFESVKRGAIDGIEEILKVDLFPSPEAEQEWLKRLEIQDNEVHEEHTGASSAKPQSGATDPKVNRKLSTAQRKELMRRIEPFLLELMDSRMDIMINLSSIAVNARNTDAVVKEKVVTQVARALDHISEIMVQIFAQAVKDEAKVMSLMNVISRFTAYSLADEYLADPFLAPTFRKVLRQEKSPSVRLILLDLLLCCGESVEDDIVKELKQVRHYHLTLTAYLRGMSLYQFRFHRMIDRDRLRKMLAEIRKVHKNLHLPPIPTAI